MSTEKYCGDPHCQHCKPSGGKALRLRVFEQLSNTHGLLIDVGGDFVKAFDGIESLPESYLESLCGDILQAQDAIGRVYEALRGNPNW